MTINLNEADYLIDTSVLSGLLDENNCHHDRVKMWLMNASKDCRMLVSVIAIAELKFGRQLAMAANSLPALPYLDHVISKAEEFDLLPVMPPTTTEYARLKANLALSKRPKKVAERKNSKWGNPELWRDQFTGNLLHIQENDLWQSAQAIERDLIFVTIDKGVDAIAEVSDGRLLHLVL